MLLEDEQSDFILGTVEVEVAVESARARLMCNPKSVKRVASRS